MARNLQVPDGWRLVRLRVREDRVSPFWLSTLLRAGSCQSTSCAHTSNERPSVCEDKKGSRCR